MNKYLVKLIIVVIFLTNISFPQWSNDPNNNLIIGYGLDPHICSDSAGGCYITYDYENIYYPRKLALERLDKYGYKPWGTKKQIVGELPEQWHAEIIEDGEGGVIVGYDDNEWIPPYYFKSRVRVQKVDSNGNFLWGQTGLRVSIEEKTHGAQELVNDSEGGCVVLWQDNIGQYYINRISGLGERVWGDSGKVIGTSASTGMRIIRASDNNFYIQTGEYIYRIRQNGEIVRRDSVTLGYIVPDSEGGIVLSGRVWTGMIPKLVAQRQDSLGNNLWQEPYVEIADSLYMNTVLMIQKNDGYFYYGWSGKKDGVDRVAQFQVLRLDGSKLFPDGSISISSHTPLSVAGIVPSESGKTIFIWNDATIASSTITQLFDTLGNKLWNENGIVVSYPAIAYKTTTDGQGGFITGGPINQFTIVAQQVNKYGELGEIITSITAEYKDIFPTETTLCQNYPNPFNPTTAIKFAIPKESIVNLSIYNVLGELVSTLVNEQKKPGYYEYKFDASNLASGVYLYRIKAGDFVETKKMILLR